MYAYVSQSHKAVADCDTWSLAGVLGTSSALALIQAINDGSTWLLIGPGQFGPSGISVDNIIGSVGQLYTAAGLATRMVISSIISRAAFLERLARHDWCRGAHRPAVLGGGSGAGDGAHGTEKRASSLVIEHMQSGAISAAFDER